MDEFNKTVEKVDFVMFEDEYLEDMLSVLIE
jgi:hypothetical protein